MHGQAMRLRSSMADSPLSRFGSRRLSAAALAAAASSEKPLHFFHCARRRGLARTYPSCSVYVAMPRLLRVVTESER
jgi:hypothetical protein